QPASPTRHLNAPECLRPRCRVRRRRRRGDELRRPQRGGGSRPRPPPHVAVSEATVRDLAHGCIFTRGPKELRHTAIFIGGTDMAAGERLLAAVRKAFFGPVRGSVMLGSKRGGNLGGCA